jgi:hypothetical protein
MVEAKVSHGEEELHGGIVTQVVLYLLCGEELLRLLLAGLKHID